MSIEGETGSQTVSERTVRTGERGKSSREHMTIASLHLPSFLLSNTWVLVEPPHNSRLWRITVAMIRLPVCPITPRAMACWAPASRYAFFARDMPLNAAN